MSDKETTTAFIARTEKTTRRSIVEDVLAMGDIRIDGARPWDIQIHDDRFYKRVLAEDALGLGESYVEGWWDVEELDAFFFRLLSIDLSDVRMSWKRKWTLLQDRLLNRQSKDRAFQIGKHHYDRGNDLFRVMLDRRMTYTCGYWTEDHRSSRASLAHLILSRPSVNTNFRFGFSRGLYLYDAMSNRAVWIADERIS